MERKYMMYEGEDVNTIDVLYEKPTTERNGVKIIIPVKYNDVWNFKGKIKEQLAYFESVFFDCGDLIDNSFKIERHEHFQFSPLATDNYLHICLDNVYYSLDFGKLGIDRLHIPIALRFSLTDGIFPTPNRESIRYTKEAKDAIMKKLQLMADFFIDKYNESVKDGDDVMQMMNFYRDENRLIKGFFSSKDLDIKELKKYSSKSFAKPKLKGIKILDMKRLYDRRDYILDEWVTKFYLANGKLYSKTARNGDIPFHHLMTGQGSFYTFSGKLPGIKKDWVRATFPRESFLVKKEKEFKLGKWKQTGNGDNTLLRNLLDLDKYPKYHWRAVITEFYEVLRMITSKWQDLDQMIVPDEFIASRKKAPVQMVKGNGSFSNKGMGRRKKLTGEVIGKQATELERFVQGQNCKWVSTTYQMAEAHKAPFLMIYGGQKDVTNMDKLYEAVKRQKVKFVLLSDRELKVVNNINLHNWINIEKIMKGEHKVIRRVVTAYLIDKFIDDHDKVFGNLEVFEEVSKDFYNKLVTLKKYVKDHHADNEKDFMDEICELMIKQDLVDTTIYDVYIDMKGLFAKLTFLDPLFGGFGYVGPSMKTGLASVVADLFKYYKQKVNLDKYNITLNEQPAAEQETIDQLVNI